MSYLIPEKLMQTTVKISTGNLNASGFYH